MGVALSAEKFIDRAKKRHNNLYDYSKVVYKPGNEKIVIICKKHGEFLQSPHNHMRGQGCLECGLDRTHNSNKIPISKEDFIKESFKIHSNKYNYSKVDSAVFSSTKIVIICKKHGEFLQSPLRHLQGQTCFKCAREKVGHSLRKTQKHFLKDALLKHGNRYDYSKSIYSNNNKKITIICKKHGEFLQSPLMHLQGNGCHKCHYESLFDSRRMPEKEFIYRSEKKHHNTYDYSKVKYINISEKVAIGCPIHGDFLQQPSTHLKGHGCPICNESKGENKIAHWLKNKKITFIREKIFKECKDKTYLRFDFYLPEYETCIEYDGSQHFIQCDRFGNNSLEAIKKRDEIKNDFAKKESLNLIRIPYTQFKLICIILEKALS